MLLVCIDCKKVFGCYIGMTRNTCSPSLECHLAQSYGLCDRNSVDNPKTTKSGGLCKDCKEKALERIRLRREQDDITGEPV